MGNLIRALAVVAAVFALYLGATWLAHALENTLGAAILIGSLIAAPIAGMVAVKKHFF